jgi:hypothetical protein
MPLIGILLSQYWKPLALAAVIAAALGYRALLVHQRDGARQEVSQVTAEAAALRTTNQALGAMIDRQNAAVAELKARADAVTNAMAASENAAAQAGTAAQGQAEEEGRALIAAPIQSGAGCEGAIRWGNAQAGALASW